MYDQSHSCHHLCRLHIYVWRQGYLNIDMQSAEVMTKMVSLSMQTHSSTILTGRVQVWRKKVVNVYWKRRTLETILMGIAEQTMNLYCSLHLSQIWNPIFILITSLPILSALFSHTADEDLHGRNVLLSNKNLLFHLLKKVCVYSNISRRD